MEKSEQRFFLWVDGERNEETFQNEDNVLYFDRELSYKDVCIVKNYQRVHFKICIRLYQNFLKL